MESDRTQERIVTFQLGKERYGIPIEFVESIERKGAITAIPHLPGFCVGIFALRGQSVPIIDLRMRLGIEAEKNEDYTSQYIVVTKIGTRLVGLLVGTVHEVIPADSGWLETDIAFVTGLPESDYLRGVLNLPTGGFVILLNLPTLLSLKEQESLNTIVP